MRSSYKPHSNQQTKNQSRAIYHKKRETSTEKPQNEMAVRNTKEEKQWKYRLGGIKSSCINNHSKCKSIEFSNQQTQSGGVD